MRSGDRYPLGLGLIFLFATAVLAIAFVVLFGVDWYLTEL
jgi:hypothetical protein